MIIQNYHGVIPTSAKKRIGFVTFAICRYFKRFVILENTKDENASIILHNNNFQVFPTEKDITKMWKYTTNITWLFELYYQRTEDLYIVLTDKLIEPVSKILPDRKIVVWKDYMINYVIIKKARVLFSPNETATLVSLKGDKQEELMRKLLEKNNILK